MFSTKVKASIAMSAVIIGHTMPVQAAAFMTGTELLGYCKKQTGVDLCTGYIEGVTDTYMRLMKLRGASDQKPCLPSDASGNTVRGAVITYLDKNPADQIYEADDAVLLAIFSAWPACKPGAQ